MSRLDGANKVVDGRKIWRLFAENYYLLRSTPSKMWIDHSFENVFGLTDAFSPKTADTFYDHIAECLNRDEFRPRELFKRFGIEVLSTTENPLDPLNHHKSIQASGWTGRVITAYRPDNVIDPEFGSFAENVAQLGVLTGRRYKQLERLFGSIVTGVIFSRSMEQHHLIMAIQLLELNVFLVLRPSGFC